MDMTLHKWQLGLIVGTPVVYGIGKYLVKKMITPRPKAVAKAEEEEQPPPDEGPDASAILAENNQLEASVETFGRKDGAGDSNDLEYRHLVADVGDYCMAMETEIRKHCRGMSVLYQNRAVWHVVLKNWAKVKEDSAKALEFDCRNGMAYLSRARAYDATGELQECLNDLEAARALFRVSSIANESPEYESIQTFWKRVLLQGARADAKKIMRQRGSLFPSKVRINSYMQAFIADPLMKLSFPRPLKENEVLRGFPRALWAFREERFEDVIPACTEEIDTLEYWSQYKTEARLMRGTFHLLCGSFYECHQDFEAVIGDAKANNELRAYALIRSAALCFQLRRQNKAMDAFEQAERLVRDNPDVYHQRGLILSKLEHYEVALMDFEMAARLAPGHVSPVVLKHFTEYHLSSLENDPQRMETALKKLDEVPLAHPNSIDAYMMRGSLLARRKDFVEALLCFERATELAPKNPVLMVNRAILELKRHGNAELVLPMLYEAIELDPRCHMTYPILVTLEIKRNNPEKAIELLNQSCLHTGTYNEVLHACSMRNALMARTVARKNLGIDCDPPKTTD
ncbi:mitochondrial import receptor subunit TOM70-like [Drosophila miranda]|uniref:mitochondrial import receptor subunit TOM70-like n=1 Tax=Drosophila miranda TaxID=7229 RepID=UPI0007E70DBE|nr:mitochondrial import receptor subunit TOM70-like [Drosophila miranda]